MAQIPLNKFVRKIFTLPTYTTNIEPFYICPSQRATIVLTIQGANKSNNVSTLTVGVSNVETKTLYYLVSGFPIPVKDSANVALGKVLIVAGDSLVAFSDTTNAVDASFSLLEAFNEA
jgi:hypothetical protein